MFKVSLLPASYRKQLENKAKKDLLEKIALLVLICMLIVFAGVFTKGQILDSKLAKVQAENAKLEQQFPDLQKYQTIYDELNASRQMLISVWPKGIDATSFIVKLSNITPDYIEIKSLSLDNWFAEGTCTIQCKCMDYSDMQGYQNILQQGELKDSIASVQFSAPSRQVDADGNKSVEFTVVLGLSSAVAAPNQNAEVNVAESTTKASADKDSATTQPTTTAAQTTTEKAEESKPTEQKETTDKQAETESTSQKA